MTREIKKLSCPLLLAALCAFGAACSSSPETGITKGSGGHPLRRRWVDANWWEYEGSRRGHDCHWGSVTGGSTSSAGGTMAVTGGISKGVGGATSATGGSATSTGGNTAGTGGLGGTGGIRDAGAAGGTTSAAGTVSTGDATSTGGTSSTGGSRDAAVADGATSTGGSRDAAIVDGATSTGGSRDAAVADGATSTGGSRDAAVTAGATSTGGAGGASGAGGSQMQPFKGIAGGACKVRTAMKVSWYYNWSPSENEACAVPNGVEYVPMIWGAGTAASIQTTVAGLASKGFKYVLGFNEPDNATQSNITVASAIALLPAFNSPTIAVGTPLDSGQYDRASVVHAVHGRRCGQHRAASRRHCYSLVRLECGLVRRRGLTA